MVNLAPYLATDHASINFHANLDFISRNKRFLSKRFICTAIVGGGIASLTILWCSWWLANGFIVHFNYRSNFPIFSGFALIIDRKSSDFSQVRRTFQRLVTLFPARIREVYLLHGPSGLQQKDLLINQLIEEFLLDFDIFHLNEANELMHHLEPKFIPNELGGHLVNDIEGWLLLQEHVETFSFSARRIARRLAQFVGVLNQVNDRVEYILVFLL